jgi:hypothetical protein
MSKTIKLSKLVPNDLNPRFIRDSKYKKLLKSINESGAFMELRPIIVDENMIILGGNMRYKACQELKMKDVHYDVFTREMADKMNEKAVLENRKTFTYEEYCNEFVIKDNVGFGEWEYDILANTWDQTKLEEWGLDIHTNSDINLEDFFEENGDSEKDQKFKIILEYSETEFAEITELFKKYKGSKEEIVFNILKK